MSLLTSLAELIFPPRCLGCSVLGPSICSRCRIAWRPRLYRNFYGKASKGIRVYSAIQYSPIAQKVLLASKESGLEIADQLIFESIRYPLTYFRQEIGDGILVPIPSRAAMIRKRGRNVLSDLVAQILADSGRGATEFPQGALTHSRRVRDQSLLSSSQRALNLHGALETIPGIDGISGNPVILIDDLVTSGATLLEATRAMRASGFVVLGAVTACVSQPLR